MRTINKADIGSSSRSSEKKLKKGSTLDLAPLVSEKTLAFISIALVMLIWWGVYFVIDNMFTYESKTEKVNLSPKTYFAIGKRANQISNR